MKFKDLPAAIGRSIDNSRWGLVIILAVWLALAPWPFEPEPHLLQKTRFLLEGHLSQPMDIFDFFYHSVGLMFLGVKGVRQLRGAANRGAADGE